MSLFDKATPLDEPVKKTSKGKTRPKVEIQGLEEAALVCVAIQALKGYVALVEPPVEAQEKEIFVESKHKPESIQVFEGIGECLTTPRQKTSRSTLSEDAVERLKAKGYTPTLLEDQKELFAIHPDDVADTTLMKKAEKVLAKHLPELRFVKQAQKARYVADADLIKDVYSRGDAAEFFDDLICISHKYSLSIFDDKKMLAVIKKALSRN